MKIRYFTFDQIVKRVGPNFDDDIELWKSKRKYGPVQEFNEFVAEEEDGYFFHYSNEPSDILSILKNGKIWLREFSIPEWIDKRKNNDDPGPDILHRVWEGIEVFTGKEPVTFVYMVVEKKTNKTYKIFSEEYDAYNFISYSPSPFVGGEYEVVPIKVDM